MDGHARVLYPNEIECYMDSLQAFDVSEIGSVRWFGQRDRIYKLCLQAAAEAKAGGDEMVKEELVVRRKVPVLVHELVATELWRLNVLPHLLKSDRLSESVIPLYMVLYHEVTLLSFLETVLFHEETVECAGDCLLDLADYCNRRMVAFNSPDPERGEEESPDDDAERILAQKEKIDFESGLKCVSIASCMAQHKDALPLSVLHRLLSVHDAPLLFAGLLCDPPWVRHGERGETLKYADGEWRRVSPPELSKLSKAEGQLWMALIRLLLDRDCQTKYDMTGFRKERILKLRSKLNGAVVDQIPVLSELLRYLEHLSLFDPPPPRPGVVIEQIPEIWESLLAKNRGKWKEVAKRQGEEHFSMSRDQLRDFCTRMSGCFDAVNMEAMMSEGPACAHCHGRGLKRCSRCRNEWYCGRSCQVSHWTKHKPACDLMASGS